MAADRQEITVARGFAYGVTGADLHVFADGVPLYLLANWAGADEAELSWLREMPSRMLNARFAIVNFTGRQDELARLREWRETGPRLAVQWLHAPGGTGKTRLAAQFAAESTAAGWKAVTAVRGPGSILPDLPSQDVRPGDAAGLLFIVDYADQWPLTHLVILLSNPLFAQSALRTRILLLARTADSWGRVREQLDIGPFTPSSEFLPPLPAGLAQREEMFAAARDSFSRCYGLDDASGIGPSVPLDHPDLGLTLSVHVAALVAVDARTEPSRAPADPAGLTAYLLNREHAYWREGRGHGSHELNPAERTFTTSPAVMSRVVFAAALTGPVPKAAGIDALRGLDDAPEPEQALADHSVCYPPARQADGTVLEPLYPDRLAEDYLALTIPGHHADFQAKQWAAGTGRALLARSPRGDAATWTPRAVTFLAAAAERWPHVATQYLNTMLLEDPRLAIEAGNAALSALAAAGGVSIPALEAIEGLLPADRVADLDPGIAAIARRLASHRLEHTTDPGHQARILSDLGRRLSYAGLDEEALKATENAVRVRRSLAAIAPEVYEPDLAASLTDLAIRQSRLGSLAEAVATTSEAVAIYQRLVAARAGTHDPGLAVALNNLGVDLQSLGRKADAIRATRQALAIYRRLAAADPDDFASDLARTLNNLGTDLAEIGEREEALAATEQAVQLYRQLATARPGPFEPELARSLSNAGLRLTELGRRTEGLAAAEEAATLYRRLAAANPTAFDAHLARALANFSSLLARAGRVDDGLAAAYEATDTYRRLAAAIPAAFEPELAVALTNLGALLWGNGQRHEALNHTQGALSLLSRLAAANPAAFESRLASALSNYSIRLNGLGRRAEAVTAASDSVSIYKRLDATDPHAFDEGLASALLNLGVALAEDGQHEEALTRTEESAEISQRLAKGNPDLFEPDLARALNNLSLRLSALDRNNDAAAAAEQSVAVYRKLWRAAPTVYEADLARSLSNAGIMLWMAGRRQEGHEDFQEAVGRLEKLSTARPRAYAPDLANALTNLSASLASLGRLSDALAATRHSAEIYRRLAADYPQAFEGQLARTLANLSLLEAEANRRLAEPPRLPRPRVALGDSR